MLRCFKQLVTATAFVVLAMLFFASPSRAAPEFAGTPYDLVNAVNALRVANGLPAYSINSILMFTAQNQADFMAATGVVAHSGAGGSSVTSRILAAGYPLAGDLSLGGFRSENIIAGTSGMSAQAAIDAWMGDTPHQNTMLSPDLTEIGAGVAIVNGRVYYVVDCARPTTSGAPQAATQAVEGGSVIPGAGAVIYPVVQSTPNADGNVIHEVRAGQSLWQIAIDYGVKIDEIKRLNNLFDNDIYPGNKLLIKKVATSIAAPSTETPTPEMTATLTPSVTVMPSLVATATQLPVSSAAKNNRVLMTIAIVLIALVGGGVFTWSGSSTKDESS